MFFDIFCSTTEYVPPGACVCLRAEKVYVRVSGVSTVV